MSLLLIIFFLLVGVILQSWLPTPFFFGSIEWPVLTGILIFTALRTSRPRAVCAAVLAGILYDSFTPMPLGTSIVFFTLLGYGVSLLRDIVVVDQLITYFILGTVAVLVKTLYFSFILPITGLRPLQVGMLPVRLAGSLFFGLFAVPLVYTVLYFICRIIPHRRRPVWQ